MDDGCTADKHGTTRAYRYHGCRCPEIVERVRGHWRRKRLPGERRHHAKDRSPFVDEIAVERALAGDRVYLTIRERGIVVDRLTAAGKSARQISELLGISYRTVTRYRSGEIKHAACPQPVDTPVDSVLPQGIAVAA